jgi:hypothetical protein
MLDGVFYRMARHMTYDNLPIDDKILRDRQKAADRYLGVRAIRQSVEVNFAFDHSVLP